MTVRIRSATLADLATLAALGARTFSDTFGHLYPQDDLQVFLAEHHSEAAYAWMLTDPAYALWIAEGGDQAIGYAQAGPARLPHPEVHVGDGELDRLYVLDHAHNSGIGSALLVEALRWLERDGPRTLWLSVWSENHRAQRLYARQGFEYFAEYAFRVGRQRDREFIFRRKPGVSGR